jgi:NADH-quinone oxidoreductase subunit I
MTGKGIISGMLVTARNFVGSYFRKERMTTVQYPEQRETPEENYRNFPFLVFDGDPEAGLRCTACKICEKECPPQCIYIVMQRDENGKATKHPKVFDIDISVCMSCQICVEVCPFESIKMDKVYELSTRDRFGKLLLRKDELSKSNEYYHSIRPTEATAVDDALAEQAAAAEAKKKAIAEKKAAAAAAAKMAEEEQAG